MWFQLSAATPCINREIRFTRHVSIFRPDYLPDYIIYLQNRLAPKGGLYHTIHIYTYNVHRTLCVVRPVPRVRDLVWFFFSPAVVRLVSCTHYTHTHTLLFSIQKLVGSGPGSPVSCSNNKKKKYRISFKRDVYSG